jgi:hypothetical protein
MAVGESGNEHLHTLLKAKSKQMRTPVGMSIMFMLLPFELNSHDALNEIII